MDFRSMKRRELQGLCKQHKLPANLPNLEMVEKLSSVFKAQEKEKPTRQMRSCLKEPAEILSENDSDISNRNLKKVRFSPENDVFEISENKGMERVNYRMRGVEDKGSRVVQNEDSPIRVTRASRQASFGGHKVLISSPVVVRKRGKRAVKEMEKNDKELRLVADLNDNTADVRTKVIAGKLLRNRKVDNVVVSKKNVRKRITQKRSEASENNGPTADGRNTRPENVLRRSRRNMEETEDSNGLKAELDNIDLVGKRNIRSEKCSAVGGETKTETEFKNEDAHMISRKSLRQRSQLRTNTKNSDDVFEKKALSLDGDIAEPEKALRRSKRNGTEFVKLGSSQKELGKAEMAGRRNTRSRAQLPMKSSIVNTESGTKCVIREASEVLLEVEKPLQHIDRHVNRRRTDLGNKVDGEIEAAVQFDEPATRQTRFSIRRKSVMPQIRKVRTEEHVTGNLRHNKIGEKDSSSKSKELKKGSKTEGHVRRSRRNASGDDSLVISDGANGIGNSVGKIKTRKRGREAIQEEELLRHTGQHVKSPSTDFGDTVEGETEVAVQFDESVQRQTRFGSRQKSVMPKIKKVRINEPVAGYLGPNRIIEEADSPNQSRELFMGQKGSETGRHVRRSRRNASGDDSLAPSDGANGTGGALGKSKPRKRGREAIQVEENVETEHAPVVEEPSRQFILSASKSETDRPAYVTRKRSGKKPESSSKSPISEVQSSLPEYTSSLGGTASVDVQFSFPEVPRCSIDPVSSTSAIVKDKIACAPLQDSSNEANAKAPNSVEVRDLVLMNEVETSASCSVKLQTDQELEIGISASKYAPIAQEPSRRVTRSATKGKTDRPVYGKLSQKKPQRSSKLPLLKVEASLPVLTSIVEGPAIVDVQSLPDIFVCTSDQVLSTSDILREKADFSIPQDNSIKANAETPNLEESKGLDLMNTSPSKFLKLQTDHIELELDIAASEHATVEKPASADVQLSLPEVAGSTIDPVSSTGHIGKDNTVCGIQQDCSTEANTGIPTLVRLKPAENFNVVENASPKDTTAVADGFSVVDQIYSIGVEEKPQTSKDVQQSFIVVDHDVVVEGVSTHEEQPIYQLSLPEVPGSTTDPVSITSDIGEKTACAIRQGSLTEANAETPSLVHLKPKENLDVAEDAGSIDTTSVIDGVLLADQINSVEMEEKLQANKDVQPRSTVVDHGVVEQDTIHEEQPITETGELDEFHGPIRQESDICYRSAGPIQSGGLEKDNGNATKEIGEASFVDLHYAASFVDLHYAAVSTFLVEEKNNARTTEKSMEAAEPHNSSSKLEKQEKEVAVPKGNLVKDEPSILDVLSEPEVCETKLSTVLYHNKEVLEDIHQKRSESAPKSCLKKQESCTSIYIEFSNSKEVGYSLAEGSEELEPKSSPSLSSANSVPDGAAEDGKSCFHRELNSIESDEVYEGVVSKDGNDGFEIIKEVGILDDSNRERSDSKMFHEDKIDGEDSDQTMQEPVSVSQVVDYNFGGGKSTENEFRDYSISSKMMLSQKVNTESKYKEEFPFDQQLILQHDWIKSNIADRDAEIFDGIMSIGEDSLYDDGVGVGSLGGGEEAIAVEKIKIHGSSTGETSRQVISEKDNDRAGILHCPIPTSGFSVVVNDDILHCQTPLKGSDGSEYDDGVGVGSLGGGEEAIAVEKIKILGSSTGETSRQVISEKDNDRAGILHCPIPTPGFSVVFNDDILHCQTPLKGSDGSEYDDAVGVGSLGGGEEAVAVEKIKILGSSTGETSRQVISEQDNDRAGILHCPIPTPGFYVVVNDDILHCQAPLKGSDGSEYNDGVGVGSLGGGEEAIAVEKIKIHGSSTGETSRQVISEKDNDRAGILHCTIPSPGFSVAVNDDILHCQTPLKGNDGSMVVSMAETSRNVGDERELNEVVGAKESDHQCSFKVISLQNTEKEITSAGSKESEQESQLKTLFETPDTTTRYSEKQTSNDDLEHSVVAISLENTLNWTIHGRLSQGKPLEMVELKDRGDNEGSSLRSKSEEITGEGSNSIEHANFCTAATLAQINSKDFEGFSSQMAAELIESTTRCIRGTDSLEDQNNEQICSPGSLGTDKVMFEGESAKRNLNTRSTSAGDLLDGGSCHEISDKVMDILSTAALKAVDCGKNTNDYHSFVETVPELEMNFGEIVQGMDERAFLDQGDIDFMKVKDVETPKLRIVATDAEHRIDLGDDASGVPTEEILINDDVMKEDDHAKLLHSNVTQTSTEETNEARGSSDYLNDSSEYGATELIDDSVMFSSELNLFLRADEVQEEKSNVLSQENIFILENNEDAGEEQETLTISMAEEQLCNPGGEQLGEKDAGLVNNQLAASDVPNCEDDKISEDINVATLDKAQFESECNDGVHLTNSTKQDEDLTNLKNKTIASMDDESFVGGKCDVEASELRKASASSEANLRMGDQSTAYADDASDGDAWKGKLEMNIVQSNITDTH